MHDPVAPPPAGFRSGYVTLLGAPNAGKSTLLNAMLGEKISITAKKPQTTRNRISGILHRPSAQIVFLDTPGVHASTKTMNQRIVSTAIATLAEADVVVLLVDMSARDAASENLLLTHLAEVNRPVILALNKIDRCDRAAVLRGIDEWSSRYAFTDIVPISALKGTQLADLQDAMETRLPEGPPFYPVDSITDQSVRFIAAELIREKAIRLTGEEIPYAVAVTIESFKASPEKKRVNIQATIHVERDSQKGIIIGKGGAKLKEIGTAARRDIAQLLGSRVFLKLFVRVQKNWTRDTKALRRFGY
jgi:GTP-binding protein Era